MREEVGTAVAAEVTARPFCTGPALGQPVRSFQQRPGPGAPVSVAAPAGPPGAPLAAGSEKCSRPTPSISLLQKDPAVVQV